MSEVTLVCPYDERYTLVLDPTEIDPDEPGNGTPEMVYGPNDSGSTLYTATWTGELLSDTGAAPMPQSVWDWLDSEQVDQAVVAFWKEYS